MHTPAGSQGLLAPERRAKILEQVRQDKSVLVKDLCAQFGVTGETIRKDLSLLEQEGRLIKTYGGAYIQEGVKNEIDASIRKVLLPEAKDAIGARCAALVEAGDTVTLQLRVAPEDMGKVIGRQGRIAKEIRALVKAHGLRDGRKIMVDILD